MCLWFHFGSIMYFACIFFLLHTSTKLVVFFSFRAWLRTATAADVSLIHFYIITHCTCIFFLSLFSSYTHIGIHFFLFRSCPYSNCCWCVFNSFRYYNALCVFFLSLFSSYTHEYWIGLHFFFFSRVPAQQLLLMCMRKERWAQMATFRFEFLEHLNAMTYLGVCGAIL